MNTNDTIPQWAVEAEKEIKAAQLAYICAEPYTPTPNIASIIARHAPQSSATPDETCPRGKDTSEQKAEPAIESHVCDGTKSSLNTGRLAPGERAYAGKPAAAETPRTDAELVANLEGRQSMPFSDFARQLARELAEVNRRADFLQSQHDKIVGELAEARKERESLTNIINQRGDTIDALRVQVAARDGVIARKDKVLRSSLDVVDSSHWPTYRREIEAAIEITPATYADALAREKQRADQEEMAAAKYAKTIFTLRAELAELRWLLATLDSALKGNMDYEHAVIEGDPASDSCITPAKLVRARLATPTAGGKETNK